MIERGIIGPLGTPYAIPVMKDLARQTGQGHSLRVSTPGLVEDKPTTAATLAALGCTNSQQPDSVSPR
ncbi:hypothetical protein HAX54_031297 [Datura stramonium]|uniref:Uncharacterized protein n=1 Tax=Datura stramonium TaxID=4076 RepID=A0ABS8V913_DATST|nr:hypothetical protein [Datura stramonium]